MDFIETIKQRAKQDKKTIVLPEAEDIRTLKATEIALKEKYANIILIGNEKNIKEKAKENNINIKEATIIDPTTDPNNKKYIKLLYELRKHKGMTQEQAKQIALDPVYYGMLMVKDEETKADGLVSGAAHSTADSTYIKTSTSNTKNSTRHKISFSFFCYGCTKL